LIFLYFASLWEKLIDTFSTSVLVGIQKILQLIKSEDLEVQIQAVKVVANLAAEGAVSSLY